MIDRGKEAAGADRERRIVHTVYGNNRWGLRMNPSTRKTQYK